MMKPLTHLTVFGILPTLLLSACKRDIPIPPINTEHTVTFRVSGFDAKISPLGDVQSRSRLHAASGGGTQAVKGIEPSLEPQHLYYWSFNEETLEPDIAVDEVGAGITFEASNTALDFGAGFGLSPFPAGRALRLVGARSITVSLPMGAIESLTNFEFDVSSSNTGPKDFILSYSADGGATYEILSLTNQFENMGSQSRNRYMFDVSGLLESSANNSLKLKFEFLSGDRAGAGDYNENAGVVLLDNIRLSGVFNTEVEPGDPLVPSKLHYYIFSSADGGLVSQKEMSLADLGDDGSLEVKLAEGQYDVVFVAYRSDKGILLPETMTNANAFYFGQHFDDYKAVTYAALLHGVEVDGTDREAAATLHRCYSLVEFDFTDLADDLQAVKKIVVTKDHDHYLYTPFGFPASSPISDAQSITFTGFTNRDDYRIALHQFFGLLEHTYGVNYVLTAYGNDEEILNTLTISQDIRNNVRLRLTGRLLGNTGAINGFAIELQTAWDETLTDEF
ncbi:hypothetical protein ACFOET_13735 [Parapedobacter deserti]|uniref:DUF4270 family protein n=1 Tax=Parapedobacter deserti TaxID=1912957 RepID=A0ABV7JNM3_9SPHI